MYVKLRASERSELSEHTVVLSLTFCLYIYIYVEEMYGWLFDSRTRHSVEHRTHVLTALG